MIQEMTNTLLCEISSKNRFPGITKTGYCQGNYVCPNKKCPFMDFSTGKTS